MLSKRTNKKNLPVILESDFPDMASHCPQAECGFSLYRGVLVQWDEDEDERILTFIDEMPKMVRARLLVAQEHEACVSLVWEDIVPEGYEENSDFTVEGDIWHVVKSVAA